MIVVDTDVLIDSLNGKNPSSDRVSREIQSGTLATTTITVFELFSGAKTGRARDAVEKLLWALRVIPLDEESGATAAAIRRELEGRGTTIGMADYLIAGICRARSLPLLTRNRSHFERVTGLRVEAP
ncbi:MAG: type II toxin-antitoxin system VapC family toxin [Acidobacteriota bacterium]|nr:MAG: type II toxin-antitoxin system VapC family toxin [Acidobacteriota bacterium]